MPCRCTPLPAGGRLRLHPQRLQELAARQPDHPAVHDETGTLTWRQFVDGVNRVANRLRAAGLQRGDTVAGLSENSARYLTLFMGTLTAGGCMVPLSGMAAGETLALMVNDCDARFLFVSDKHRALIEPLLDSLHNVAPDGRVALDFQGDGWLDFEDWLGDARADARTIRRPWTTRSISSTAPAPPACPRAFSTITGCAPATWSAATPWAMTRTR